MRDTGRFKERYDFSLDSRQLGLVLLAGIVAASLLFVLGMSVGRQWERKLAAKEPAAAAQQPAPVKPPAPEEVVPAAPPVDPASADVVQDTDAKVETPAAKEPEKEEPAQKTMKPEELTFPKVLTAKGKPPLTEPKPAKSGKPAPAKGRFTVQVGAYKDKTSADELMARLKKDGYSPSVHVNDGSGGSRIYKVHVGSFGSKNDAQKMADRLASSGRFKPYVTSY